MRAAVRKEIRKAAARYLATMELDDLPVSPAELEQEIYYMQALLLGKKCNRVYYKPTLKKRHARIL